MARNLDQRTARPTTTPPTDRRLASIAAACLGAFVVLAVLIRSGWTPLTHLDLRIARDLHAVALDHPGQVTVWRGVSAVLSPSVVRIAAVVAAVVVFLIRREVWAPVVLVVAVLGTVFLSPLTKILVDRNRPHFATAVAHASGQSYPSGHALTSFVAVVAVLALCPPRVRRLMFAPALIVVAAVGYSRLFLGVHYPSDVVGGWLLGGAWFCVVLLVLRSPLAARMRA